MNPSQGKDYFDRARSVAVWLAALAATAAIAGSFLPWTTAGSFAGEDLPPGTSLERLEELSSEPVTGFEAGDGKVVIGAAVVLLVTSLLLGLSRNRRYGYLAALSSLVVGGISFAFFGQINDATSDFHRRLEIVGDIDAGPGLYLAVAGGVAGLIAAVLGLVATPSADPGDG